MSWYHIPGQQQDVAVSTCVRLTRNLTGYPFPARLDAPGAKAVIEAVGAVLEKNGFIRTELAEVSRSAAESLAEKGFITPRFIRESLPHALFLNDPCNLAVTVCGEDHLCIQCLLSGMTLQDAFEGASKAESLLDSGLELAFDGRLGYLTADPTRLGNAMDSSVVLLLPLLGGKTDTVARRLSRRGIVMESCGGDGAGTGWLFRLSHRGGGGMTEAESLALLEGAAQSVMDAERSARDRLTGEERDRMTDRILRAEGILRHAHMLSAHELFGLLGLLRLGAAMGVTAGIRVEDLTALLIEAMPATLTAEVKTPPKNDTERDILRARVVRERIFGA